MASKRQIAANRRNAKRSTGPRTSEGKATSSLNALKHGLRAETLVLPGEDPGSFEELQNKMVASLAPFDALEEQLAREVVQLFWRLRRAARVEADLYRSRIEAQRKANQHQQAAVSALLDKIDRHDLRSDASPELVQALNQLDELAEQAEPSSTEMGDAFEDAVTTLSAFVRYEGHLSRRLFKALHELQRLQRARGGNAPPSAVLDVEVDIGR